MAATSAATHICHDTDSPMPADVLANPAPATESFNDGNLINPKFHGGSWPVKLFGETPARHQRRPLLFLRNSFHQILSKQDT